jgi:hypothetical protein
MVGLRPHGGMSGRYAAIPDGGMVGLRPHGGMSGLVLDDSGVAPLATVKGVV